jgi:hypothetical protein
MRCGLDPAVDASGAARSAIIIYPEVLRMALKAASDSFYNLTANPGT